MKSDKMVVSGKRKSAVAKATIEAGNGVVTFNKRPLNCLTNLQRLEISEPLIIAREVLFSGDNPGESGNLNFNISLNVRGGGTACQVEAGRLAIAKAIVAYTGREDIKNAFLVYDRNMLVADTRRKEACKPGDSKARANRQTSFR